MPVRRPTRRQEPKADRVPGLARPFLCDVFFPERNALVEAKSTDRREAIRMAIGQFLDYQYLEGTQRRLAVLLPRPPAAEIRDLLDSLGFGVVWQFGVGFRDSAGGAFTKS
jgi:5-methylcytosine-specific restriction protein A